MAIVSISPSQNQDPKAGFFASLCGAAETTTYPNEVSAMALAHYMGSKVEAAYRRGNLMTKRRQMMADWDAFLAGKDRKITQLYETGDAR